MENEDSDRRPDVRQRGDPKPTYERFQPGAVDRRPDRQGPDAVFGSYEENRQDRDNRVFLGTTPFPPSLDFLREYEGTFTSPFREKLLFGKLTSQPRPGQTSKSATACAPRPTSASFGQQTQLRGRREHPQPRRFRSRPAGWCPAARWLNEATVTYQRSNWNPIAGKLRTDRPELRRVSCASAGATRRRTSSRTRSRFATTTRAS